jgi:uncharacterized protein (DUF2384 family)
LWQAADLFENDKTKTLSWLFSPNLGLDGQTRSQMAQTETGLTEAENLIEGLECRVFI